jgi:hypothetical protein
MQLLVQTDLTQYCKIKHRNIPRNIKAIYLCHSARVTARSGLGLLIIEASRSNSDAAQSLGLLWTSDQPRQRHLPDNTQHSQETDIHAPAGIRNCSPSKRAAADRRPRPRGHWESQSMIEGESIPRLLFNWYECGVVGGYFSSWKSRHGVKTIIALHLQPISSMYGVIPLFPVNAFMECIGTNSLLCYLCNFRS